MRNLLIITAIFALSSLVGCINRQYDKTWKIEKTETDHTKGKSS